MPAFTVAAVTAALPDAPRDRRRAGRAQRPRGRCRGPAVVVGHRLDQGQLRGQVVVGDRARRRLTERDRDRRTGLRPADTRPRRGACTRSVRFPTARSSRWNADVGHRPGSGRTGDAVARALRAQDPVRGLCDAAVVVGHLFDERELRRDVVVHDGADHRLPECDRDRCRGARRRADACPIGRGVAGWAGTAFGERVGARRDLNRRDRCAAGNT